MLGLKHTIGAAILPRESLAPLSAAAPISSLGLAGHASLGALRTGQAALGDTGARTVGTDDVGTFVKRDAVTTRSRNI